MITFAPILPGETRDVDVLNDWYVQYAASSASVQADQFAEEGLDRRAFEAHVVAERVATISESTRAGATLAGTGSVNTFAAYVHGASSWRTGALPTLVADEALRVRARLFFGSSVGAGRGIEPGATLRARCIYDDGAGTTDVPWMYGRVSRPAALEVGYHAVMFLEGWIPAPSTVNWIELQYALVGGNARATRTALWVDHFRRIRSV